MTSATERLRVLLDERGVEWSNGHGDCDDHAGTLWDGIGGRWYAGGMTGVCGNRLYLETPADRTPEQAVAATLGPGTCHDLGGIGANEEQVFRCSECGCILSLYDRDGSNNLCTSFIFDYPRYCPECGRRVIGGVDAD